MFKTYEINEGVYFHYFKDNKFKTNTMAVLISTQIKAETAAKTALTAQIMKSGCRKYKTHKDIAVKLEEMYGSAFDVSIIKKGNRQIIYIYLETVADTFNESLEFLKEIIFYPINFEGEGFEAAKKRLIAEIDAIKDNKGQYAVDRMAEETGEGAYSVPGLGHREDVIPLKGNEMKRYYKELLTRGIIDIYFVGNIDENSVRKRKEELFGRTRCNVWQIEEESLKPENEEPRKVKEEEGLNQGKLCMCFVTGEEANKGNILSLLVLNEIIGGGGSSMLFAKVREKEGLCYSISSSVNKHKMLMVIEAGIDKDDYEKVTDIITKSLKEIKSGITEDDVKKAKHSLSKNYESVFDTPVDIINYGFTMRLLGIADSPKEFAEEIKSVTTKEVRSMAEKLKCETEYFLV